MVFFAKQPAKNYKPYGMSCLVKVAAQHGK